MDKVKMGKDLHCYLDLLTKSNKMYTFIKSQLRYKIYKTCHRFVHTETNLKKKIKWLIPVGYETNIKIYNPITKCNVPLILKNKNILTWYVCGPTAYNSAHIGHAMSYMNLDIIRRILSDYFNINIVMAMCITDIDDKIIKRSKELKQNYKDITKHYENEFIEDMQMLNIAKPHLYCRVTDYISQIIQFVQGIIDNGNAYISKDESVYFDTHKYAMYGKLMPPVSDSNHPDKKSSLDFCLWKKAKEGEPFWKSPWGPGRPGWHIECSTIASTVFGNSVDIHSGGKDLIFPHHENEEAQSCSYHGVEQWVNYWMHCGHLSLEDVKMSKSLGNTISIREFLEKYTANHIRILCLLSNYKYDLKFSDIVMNNAVRILNKIQQFIYSCENYIIGNWDIANIDEVALLRCLEETKSDVYTALADDFNTAKAMKSLLNLIDVGNNMLHKHNKNTHGSCIPAIIAVSNYISTTFSKFGIFNPTTTDDQRVNNLVEYFVKFRHTVRRRTLESDVKDKILLEACDEARSDLSACGVTVKDHKMRSIWSIKKY
ncbi:PREDICTED: probable cysteine--tRNA ligase, mitochondrial [Eufriesea mexicana]|uniref:probable cysteine--tRNA ligase, mitochondrial n=1 Tax=Eufriesea mexicana TaxID=516756 RepID=UPI00083C8AED|nr:PREDICTED: probable cysteine--tRNA ligase, mitochondrial [Eufriesea mexicana]